MGIVDAILGLPLPVLIGVAAVAYVAYLFYEYSDRAIGTRRRPDLKHAKGAVPILGHTLRVAETLPYRLEALKRDYEENGEVFRQTVYMPGVGPLDMVHTTNPQDVETILRDPYLFVKGNFLHTTVHDFLGDGIFTSDGARWNNQRKTASHVFNVRNFRDVFSGDFLNEVAALCDHLQKASEMNAVVDLQDLLLRCTLDSFGRLAMGTSFGCIDQVGHVENGKYVLPTVEFMTAFDYLNAVVAERLNRPGWKILEHLDGTAKKVKEAQKLMFSVADKVIAEKRARMAKGETFDEDGNSSSSKDAKHADMLDYFMRTKNFDGGMPDDEELRDVVMNLLIAGRDTTAQTLTWVFYTLANQPKVEAKCREEIKAALGTDGLPGYENLKDLRYVNATFNETLRLFANVPVNPLTASKDCVLAGTGTKIDAGQLVQYTPWVMGYSPKIWGPDAAEFKPERWIDEKGVLKKENQYKYPVFKAGPRVCLGQNMALQEGVTFITQILRKFHLELVNEDEPQKWGKYSEDPAKREGRYSIALTLGARGAVEFRVHSKPL
ncbi:cytochrome P450 [Hyaloraphidium curvatum]|nr:cytochrome P450 [Hyaloraphidium curvatum]